MCVIYGQQLSLDKRGGNPPLRQLTTLGIVSHLDLNECRLSTRSEPSLKLVIVASRWVSQQ